MSTQPHSVIKEPSETGFTLIEVLMAMAIFAIGILAVGSMQIAAMNGGASARRSTDAATIAQDQIEKIIAGDYDDLAAPADAVVNGRYSLNWAVAEDDLNGDGNNDAKNVTVTVTWPDKGGDRSFNLDFTKVLNIKG
ncbi:MAG: prepilin-type N-terminal cleavage/methylation domain-containing protein [Desulfobacterales bacterium]|nr:prepilin-type N-terminal cleavage/methylation domain-containing protein [Desulfobacterales bacterium]